MCLFYYCIIITLDLFYMIIIIFVIVKARE